MGQGKNEESDGVAHTDSESHDTDKEFCADLINSGPLKKKYKCTYEGCDAVFLRPNRLQRHSRLHTGERPYKCSYPECDKAYTNSSHLKRHIESHSMTKKTYQCSKCSLLITHLHNLKRHYERVHGENSKLVCKECNITFTKKHQLMTHCSTHHVKTQKCDKCDKVFTCMRKFKRHTASHEEGSKQYPCTVEGCTEIFVKWRLLRVHLKTQHVIDYKCKDCDKVFVCKTHLKIHSQVHMENRPVIPCPYEKCHRVYYFKKNLDIHVRTNHLGKKFECDICHVLISSKQRLSDHIQKIHTEKRVRKVKKLNRKKRKDTGIPKKTVVCPLIGVTLPSDVEQRILKGECNTVHLEEPDNALNNVASSL